MIYISKKDTKPSVKIPRNVSKLPSGDYSLLLRRTANRLTQDMARNGDYWEDFSFDFYQGELVVTDSRLYHDASFVWHQPQVGEYDYRLMKGGEIVAVGLLQVMEELEIVGQNTVNLIYEQYEG